MNLFTRILDWLDGKASASVAREVRTAELARYRRTLDAMGLPLQERRFEVCQTEDGRYVIIDTHARYAVAEPAPDLQKAEDTALMANYYWHTTANRKADQ